MKANIPISNDADLTMRIGIAFATRPRITWHDINVAARNGTVTLRGEVPTAYDRHLIIAVTRHVAGVRLVDDKISIAEASARRNDEAEEPVPSPTRRGADETNSEAVRQHLKQLPVLTESLEDILARSAGAPVEN